MNNYEKLLLSTKQKRFVIQLPNGKYLGEYDDCGGVKKTATVVNAAIFRKYKDAVEFALDNGTKGCRIRELKFTIEVI